MVESQYISNHDFLEVIIIVNVLVLKLFGSVITKAASWKWLSNSYFGDGFSVHLSRKKSWNGGSTPQKLVLRFHLRKI